MPTIKYPKNPNIETAFVEQDDGTKNRVVMTAPQDISTLEYPSNPNSTKGYVTVDGKKQRVIMVADIVGGGGSSLPDQTGHSGEFLTTDGTDASWAAVNTLPSQTGQAGKFLTTDGTDASWSDKPLVNTATGTGSIGIGNNIVATQGNSVVIGNTAKTGNAGSAKVAIGESARATGNGATAVGQSSVSGGLESIAIGQGATANANGAVQIKYGTNSTANTLQVGSYQLMSADGTIPTARLTKVNSIITLTAAGWSSNTQTVTVSGVTSTSVVFVAPDPSDTADYVSAGILCTSQTTDSLTFTATTTPSSDINVNVVCL